MTAASVSAPLASLAAAILIGIAVIHMYWALGGRIGVGVLAPQMSKNRGIVVRPSMAATLLVSLAFVVAAELMLTRLGVVRARIPSWGMHVACGALAAAFLVRAIGDFRYVGFFKRVRDSRFARLDTVLYSPLSLFLAVVIGINSWWTG